MYKNNRQQGQEIQYWFLDLSLWPTDLIIKIG